MSNRGSLTVTNQTWQFMTVKLPEHVAFYPELETANIGSEGVDGSLIINLHRRWPAFQVIFTASYASLAQAVTAAERLRRAKGYFGTMTLTAFGVTRTFANIHIEQAVGIPRPDTGGGPYAVSGHAATLYATIIVRPTESPST